MITIERTINNPKDIVHIVFRAAESEIDDVVEENKKRAERFRKPLEMPAWNVKQMIENINKLTERTFTNPNFQRYASANPWDGKSSAQSWTEIATMMLRDYYLVPIAKEDADLFQQLCEVWPELTPDPTLTKEQMDELASLQRQADNIMVHAEELASEFMKLVEREKEIVIGTQSKRDRRIENQTRYLKVNKYYHKERVAKW